MIQAGEIYMADFAAGGAHPVIIVSRESLNRGNQVLVVVCTSARFDTRRHLPNCVPFQAGQFGFTKDCIAQCENLLLLYRSEIDLSSGPMGVLDLTNLHRVIKAIGYVLEADCELL